MIFSDLPTPAEASGHTIELRQGFAQKPFDVTGEHAQGYMRAHAWAGPVADRADFEIDGLQ